MGDAAVGGDQSQTDGQLLHSFKNGDQAAFGELVARHGPSVLRRCRQVVGNTPDAEDVFQTTLYVLMRRAFTLREPDRVGGWLHGVAYRIGIRARRRAAKRDGLERSHGQRSWVGFPPDESLGELGKIVREAVSQLPTSYRAAITLVYLEEVTHQEAATRLGWPLGTLKVRLVRARQLLRDCLANDTACRS